MPIKVMDGSNRATCRICNEKISKGKFNQVQFSGWRISESYHRDCIKNWEKIQILKGLEDSDA